MKAINQRERLETILRGLSVRAEHEARLLADQRVIAGPSRAKLSRRLRRHQRRIRMLYQRLDGGRDAT